MVSALLGVGRLPVVSALLGVGRLPVVSALLGVGRLPVVSALLGVDRLPVVSVLLALVVESVSGALVCLVCTLCCWVYCGKWHCLQIWIRNYFYWSVTVKRNDFSNISRLVCTYI